LNLTAEAAPVVWTHGEAHEAPDRCELAGEGDRGPRLTNAFSKKVENHAHAISLHFMHYNFCRPHQTLTKKAGGKKTTPAMAAGITKYPWSLTQLAELLD
jgi:hypothetical protein